MPRALAHLKSEIAANGQINILDNPAEVSTIAQIGAAGIEIADLSTQEASLKDVFLHLTSPGGPA